MTTETSNARGEWPEELMIRDTGLHDDMGGGGQRIFTTAGRGYEKVKYVRADLAPPPAAARVDVRGLVAKWRASVRSAKQYSTTVYEDGYAAAENACANELESAIAAEGVHCDSCNGSGVVVNYVDPYERGDISSPEQSPCPDCAEGVQAGEVEVVYQARWDAVDGKPWEDITLEQYDVLQSTEAVTRILYTAPQQPEARGVVDASILQEAGDVLEAVAMSGVSLPNNWRWPLADELRGMAAALTGERNG